MKVTLLTYTPEPEKAVACAAKLCYAAASPEELLDGLTPEKTASFLDRLFSMGHESPIEHVSFTFTVEGVSRSLLAELTRHRIASYSVQSQRYVSMENFSYVTPPEIAENPEAAALFQEAMEEDRRTYDRLCELLYEKHYQAFLAEGKTDRQAASAAKKRAGEDARFVLPNACCTQLMVTMNARSLYNFFRLRCCNRAQWEIRALATEMLRLVHGVAPALFAGAGPACCRGGCDQGAMSCGKDQEVREAFAALKSGEAER